MRSVLPWYVRASSVFGRFTARINASLEQHFWRWVAVFTFVLLASSLVRDIRLRMWIDELYTLTMAKQADAGTILQATAEGCDGAPPLYALIVHFLLPIVKPEALAVRLPSTLAFCAMFVCLAALCRRHLPALYSLVASLLVCLMCWYYSTEGRGYGLVLAGGAGALLFWEIATERRRERSLPLILLALCLALMVAAHYYAIFFLVPLFIGSVVRARMTGKLDFGILAAMVSAVLVLALHYPFIATSKDFQAHYWATAGLYLMVPYYGWHLLILTFPTLALVLGLVFSRLLHQRRPYPPPVRLQLHEWIVIAVFVMMPALVITISTYTTHAFVGRYVEWALIVFALLAGGLSYPAARGDTAVGLALIGILVCGFVVKQLAPLYHGSKLHEGQAVLESLETLPDGPEPIVIADHHVFMELSYYGDPALRKRLIYADNPALDVKYLDSNTGALILSRLRYRSQLHIQPYDRVLAAYPHFLLAATSSDYLPWHLLVSGYRLAPVGTPTTQAAVFEVQAPSGQP